MSDNLRRYRAIRDALTQCYPGQPSGAGARHLITLAALISGIVGSKSTQLPHIAAKVPNGTKPDSHVKRLARWCDNARILERCGRDLVVVGLARLLDPLVETALSLVYLRRAQDSSKVPRMRAESQISKRLLCNRVR